ncbi:hypothetical protein BKA66DRAFT_455600 [Pyrenochaeta sp. MPI-SDFR-AT-0127]|nr:hypothetical protein BKA66DRAFT_455600 [Pyrenochaeta sp. MPI-SDFR-AT-0127]
MHSLTYFPLIATKENCISNHHSMLNACLTYSIQLIVTKDTYISNYRSVLNAWLDLRII